MNVKSTIVDAANQIVTKHLIKRFIGEINFFFQIVEKGTQLIVIKDKMIMSVIDATENTNAERLIEVFCKKFTDKTNILVEVMVEEKFQTETLTLITQNGEKYYIQDFSKYYLKL